MLLLRLAILIALHLPPLCRCQQQDFSLYGPCSPRNRFTNPSACFDFIRTTAMDPNLFWFGTALEQICKDNSEPRNLTCANLLPDGGTTDQYKTLGSRAFNIPNFQSSPLLDDLSCPMTVLYSSPQEFAYGCNTTQGGGNFLFDSHPNLAPLPSFFFRYAPAISVPACTRTSLCTLIMVDAYFAVIHNIWPNWPRDNPNLDGYVSPGANRLEPDPYVFYALQQFGPIHYTPADQPSASYEFSVEDFKASFNLTGPIAASWLLAVQDPYTNRYLLQYGASFASQLATCPLLLESQLQTQTATLRRDIGLDVPFNSLNFWLPIRFRLHRFADS